MSTERVICTPQTVICDGTKKPRISLRETIAAQL